MRENEPAVAKIAPQRPPVTMRMLKPGCFSRLGVLGSLSEINSPTAPSENRPTATLPAAKEAQPVTGKRCSNANQQRTAIGESARRPDNIPMTKIAHTISIVDKVAEQYQTLPHSDWLLLLRVCYSCCDRNSGYNQSCRRFAG